MQNIYDECSVYGDIRDNIGKGDYIEAENGADGTIGGVVQKIIRDVNGKAICVEIRNDFYRKKFYVLVSGISLWERWKYSLKGRR